MAQNKTTLLLNNLVVLNYPLRTSAHLHKEIQESLYEIQVKLPFLALLQKVDLIGQKDNTKKLPRIQKILRQTIGSTEWEDVIDFKKQRINWRFKSRMRSNSNEFIEGFPFNQQHHSKDSQNHSRSDATNQKPGNESFSCNSSLQIIDEDDWEEEVKGTLLCACANTFKVVLSCDDCQNSEWELASLQLSVWPTIRMPTGGSTIPLINTSFLFASRQHISESYEIDLLVAQSLVNGRKFIQAAEKIRSIESRLLRQGTKDDLYRVMLLEIIIGESMSQHSQVSEKIFAFKRAALIHAWLSLNNDDVAQLLPALNQLQKEHVKQEEAPQRLISIKSRLVAILVANIGSHIEVVRMAVLKTLEYLLDTLNCSLESQIVDILRVVCFCYPYQCEESHNKKIESFFQYEFTIQPEITQQLPFFSWSLIHNDVDCQVQDVKTLSHSYVQSALNCYNHILENMGIVLSSASHSLLTQVFKSIIVPQALNPKLPQELRIYLLKYADQILQICKGDINFSGSFLQEIIEIIVEQPRTAQSKQSHSQKWLRVQSAATQAVSPHFSNLQQVCLNLLQTMKAKYFTSLSLQTINSQQSHHANAGKGQKLFEWLVAQLSEMAGLLERSSSLKPQTLQEQRKLNILIGIVESLVQSMIDEESSAPQLLKFGLQNIYCRNDDQKPQKNQSKSFELSNKKQSMVQQKMNQNLKVLQVFLPLCQPLITLFNYSVAGQDRLSLFKQVWQLLTQIMARLPVKLTKMPHLTIRKLLQPHLERLNQFMQTSSPSKQMLEFLQIVLLSIEPPLSETESSLLQTLLHTIPHNLHDEVFQVASLMLDIYSTIISADNIFLLVSVLVHKYTMRSKEHKMLVDKVVTRILQGQEQKVLFDCFVDQCLLKNHLYAESSHDDESVFFEKLGLLQELVHKMSDLNIWHYRRLLSRSRQAFERVFAINHRSKHFMVKLLFKLSEFYMKHCAPYNYYEYPIISQAAVDVIPPQINGGTSSHQQRGPLINHLQGFHNGGFRQGNVYSEPSVELFSIGHHEDDLYFSGGLEHPRVEMDPQAAAYLEEAPRNRATRAHYRSQHVDYRPQTLINREMQEDGDDHSDLYESPRQAMLALNPSVIFDHVCLVDRDRLLLVQIHSTLIRQATESQSHQESSHFGVEDRISEANQDANVKLCVVNLIQNLFANLLPTPTLQNMTVQDIISQERVNLVEPVRMQQVQDARLEIQSEPAEVNYSQRESEEPIVQEAQATMQQTQSNAHLEIIPDFADIVIRGQSVDQEPTFPDEFECSEPRYLCARVVAFLKIVKYIENIIMTTSWANLKQLATCVLNLGCNIPNVNILPSKLQRHLKNALQPLIIKLVQNSRDSESKAAALNTLASICNLQLKSMDHFFTEGTLHTEQGDNDSPKQRYNTDAQCLEEAFQSDIQISKHLDLFRVNSTFVSVAIWQEVFDLQDDQNFVVRQAATALIQLCAPRESVSHFLQIKREQYKLKVNQLLQQSSASTQPYIGANGGSSQHEQNMSGGMTTTNNFTSTLQSHQVAQYECEQSSETSSDHSSQSGSFLNAQHHCCSEEEVREILNIFKVRLSPILSLQADRISQREPVDPYQKRITFQDMYEDGFFIDERINFQRPTQSKSKSAHSEADDDDDELHSESSSDEVYIFRRDSGRSASYRDNSQNQQAESRNTKSAFQQSPQTQQLIQVLQQDNEDLGIIDLDDSEHNQDDDFEELDDDKLPVLKNTYSKKNRPNNSKSVAIGSRSQGGTLRQLGFEQIISEKQTNTSQQNDDKRYFKTKFAAAADFIGMERIDELKSEFDRGSKSSRLVIQRGQIGDADHQNDDLQYELSVRDGLSVASLPVANRRLIQSAGGKRNQMSTTSRRSSNVVHMLSQGETFYLPNDIKNLDIEEVQIFVRRKQRPVSGRVTVYSCNSQTELPLKSLGSHQIFQKNESIDQLLRDNKLIQTDMQEELKLQSQQQKDCEDTQALPIQTSKSLQKKQQKQNSTQNIVRVISKFNRPESTLSKQKQIMTKQSVRKPTSAIKLENDQLKVSGSVQKVKRNDVSIVVGGPQMMIKKSMTKATTHTLNNLEQESLTVTDIL